MAQPIRTLADIKRRMQVGVRLTSIYRAPTFEFPLGDPDPVIQPREVLEVKAGGVWMSSTNKSGRSWMEWPMASDIRIVDGDSFEVLEDGARILSYHFV